MQIGMGMGICGGQQDDVSVTLPLTTSLAGRVNGGITFSRASGQWYQDDAGTWQYAASGVPAFNSKGILLEPAGTNKCTCHGVIPADTLGAELITNAADRELSSDTGWWSDAYLSWAGGVVTATGGGTASLERANILTLGKVYQAVFTVGNYSGGGSVGISTGTTSGGYYVPGSGTYTVTFPANVGAGGVGTFRLVSTVTGVTFDNISLKEIQFAVGTKSYHDGTTWRQNHTNMTLSGDTAVVLTTLDGAADIAGAGLSVIAPSGKWYCVTNTGAVDAYLTITGSAGNLNPHSRYFWGKVTGAGPSNVQCFVVGDGSSAIIATPNQPLAQYKKENHTSTSSDRMQFSIPPNRTFYFLLPQYEELPFCTSPMPTAGATATRAVTSLTFPSAGNLKVNDFTVYMEVTPLTAAPVGRPNYFLACWTDTNNRFTVFDTGAAFGAKKVIAGVDIGVTTATVPTVGQTTKLAVVMSATSGIKFFSAGVLRQNDTRTDNIPLAVTVEVGAQGGQNQLRGHVRSVRIYRRALPDAQLIQMTQ